MIGLWIHARPLEPFLLHPNVGPDHHDGEFLETNFRLPAQSLLRFARVADQELDLGRTIVARIDLDVLFPVQTHMAEGHIQEFANGVRFVGGNDVVVGLFLLEHQPHGFHVFLGVTPIAFGVEVSEVKFLLQSQL